MITKLSLLISIIIVGILLSPSVVAYRTFVGAGDDSPGGGTDYNKYFKPGVDATDCYLDDEYNWQTGGLPDAQGHGKDKTLDEGDAVDNIWDKKQSQLFIFIGHGGPDLADLYGGGHQLNYLDMRENTATVLFHHGHIPGTTFLFSTCSAGKNQQTGLAKNAVAQGAQIAIGGDNVFKIGFTYYWAQQYGKYYVHDSKYNNKQIIEKSFDQAYIRTGLWWILDGYRNDPEYRYHYFAGYQSGSFDTLDHKPRKEFDFDQSGVCLLEGNTWTVGGSSGITNDDGAILYINPSVPNDDDRIKIEYKSFAGDTWHDYGEWKLTSSTTHMGYDTNSEDVVVYFYKDVVQNGYLQVRVTALDDVMCFHNYRLHYFSY